MALGPQENYADRKTVARAKLVVTFAGRECPVISASDPNSR
jgi:hypothetical protein